MDRSSEFEICNHVLTKYYGSGGNVIVPEGVETIQWNAFSDCVDLLSVELPQSTQENKTPDNPANNNAKSKHTYRGRQACFFRGEPNGRPLKTEGEP